MIAAAIVNINPYARNVMIKELMVKEASSIILMHKVKAWNGNPFINQPLIQGDLANSHKCFQ
jgi:hypothetical protein